MLQITAQIQWMTRRRTVKTLILTILATALISVPCFAERRAVPYPVHRGFYPWPHWNHPGFERPAYNWDWEAVTSVTCTAADSLGNLYPVAEDGYVGAEYRDQMNALEDAALDRCHDENGQDTGCTFVDCTPGT
jgi:hypothetical protein